ncbi:unnamed protein product, partial [Ectocarpus sp. 12 AP-2014]
PPFCFSPSSVPPSLLLPPPLRLRNRPPPRVWRATNQEGRVLRPPRLPRGASVAVANGGSKGSRSSSKWEGRPDRTPEEGAAPPPPTAAAAARVEGRTEPAQPSSSAVASRAAGVVVEDDCNGRRERGQPAAVVFDFRILPSTSLAQIPPEAR